LIEHGLTSAPTQLYVIQPPVFTGLMTQPTVSKYWRRCYKGQSKQRKQQNTHMPS